MKWETRIYIHCIIDAALVFEQRKAVRTEVEEELAARAVVQDEEELVPGLEGHVEPDDEGVLDVP